MRFLFATQLLGFLNEMTFFAPKTSLKSQSSYSIWKQCHSMIFFSIKLIFFFFPPIQNVIKVLNCECHFPFVAITFVKMISIIRNNYHHRLVAIVTVFILNKVFMPNLQYFQFFFDVRTYKWKNFVFIGFLSCQLCDIYKECEMKSIFEIKQRNSNIQQSLF